MIANERGEVALVYYQPTQVYIAGNRTATGREYVFVTKFAGICLAWVDPADVDSILGMRKNCVGCGNKPRQLFNYANQAQVDIWTNGGRGEVVEQRGG